MGIYVEARVRGPLQELWRLTQTPELHERWDLRFGSISYLQRPNENEPQRFRYATRIGLGLEIEGWGESVGERQADGTRTSALRFGSEDPRSLIRAGSGYWKYVPVPDGVRFITGYDYEVRYGALGRAFDRLLFRPAMGWATAWSFDRLRLWVESGVDPAGAARRALVHAVAAGAVAFVWIWHGLVPKLLGPHADEVAILADLGTPPGWIGLLTRAAGVLEVAFGLSFVALSRRRWPWILTIVLMILATAAVLLASPRFAGATFNPVTLDLQMIALCAVGLLALRDLPSARRCLRRPPEERR